MVCKSYLFFFKKKKEEGLQDMEKEPSQYISDYLES